MKCLVAFFAIIGVLATGIGIYLFAVDQWECYKIDKKYKKKK